MNFSSHTSLIPITLWETKSYRASFCVLHEIEQHSNFQSLESPSSVNNMWTALVYASFHVASCISSALSRTTFDPSCYTNLFIPIIVRASFAHLKKNDNSLSLHQFAIQNWERQTLQVQLQHQTQRTELILFLSTTLCSTKYDLQLPSLMMFFLKRHIYGQCLQSKKKIMRGFTEVYVRTIGSTRV